MKYILIFLLWLKNAECTNNGGRDACVCLSLLASLNLCSQLSSSRQTKLMLHHHDYWMILIMKGVSALVRIKFSFSLWAWLLNLFLKFSKRGQYGVGWNDLKMPFSDIFFVCSGKPWEKKKALKKYKIKSHWLH